MIFYFFKVCNMLIDRCLLLYIDCTEATWPFNVAFFFFEPNVVQSTTINIAAVVSFFNTAESGVL